jgi:hypothetical protein
VVIQEFLELLVSPVTRELLAPLGSAEHLDSLVILALVATQVKLVHQDSVDILVK